MMKTMQRIVMTVAGVLLMAGSAGAVAQDVPLCDDVVEGMCRAAVGARSGGEYNSAWCYLIVPFDEYDSMGLDHDRSSSEGKCNDGLVHGSVRVYLGASKEYKSGRVVRGKWHGWVLQGGVRILYAEGVEKKRIEP